MAYVEKTPSKGVSSDGARRFLSAEALIDNVRKQGEAKAGELEKLQHAYRKVVGKEDPLVAERIKSISAEFEMKIAALTQWHARFVEMMSVPDARLGISNSNQRVDFESYPCYAEVESIRMRMRARSLTETEFHASQSAFAALPEAQAHPAEETQTPEAKGCAEDDEEAVPIKKTLLSHVPKGERSAFQEYVKKHQRLKEIEAKGEPTKEEIEEAIAAFNESKKAQTAMVRHEAISLAPELGVRVSRVREFLQVYSPQQLRDFAAKGTLESLPPSRLISADMMIFEDGSLSQRMPETIALVKFRESMERIITAEYSHYLKCMPTYPWNNYPGNRDNLVQSSALDELWEKTLAKHKGDIEKAKAEYSAESAKLLTTSAPRIGDDKPYMFGLKQAFEIFKLLNYDTDALEEFQNYFESSFCLEALRERFENSKRPQKWGKARLPEDVLTMMCDFVQDNAETVQLNERSRYYSRMREAQLKAIADEHAELMRWISDESDDEDMDSW